MPTELTDELLDTTFPADWDEWRRMWAEYKAARTAEGTFKRSTWKWRGENFLSDATLCRVDAYDRHVELCEVMFRIGETARYVGVTFAEGSGTWTPDSMQQTFRELDTILKEGR